jgi:hypothetical protein
VCVAVSRKPKASFVCLDGLCLDTAAAAANEAKTGRQMARASRGAQGTRNGRLTDAIDGLDAWAVMMGMMMVRREARGARCREMAVTASGLGLAGDGEGGKKVLVEFRSTRQVQGAREERAWGGREGAASCSPDCG